MSALDRAIAGAAGVTVVGLAGVAGAISYSHMAELARLHGEASWRVHAFPVSVDGIELVASLVLLAHRRAGTRAGWLPWAALVAGTTASVAANVAVGAADLVGRLVAGWPAVALLVSIKLLAGLLDAGSGHHGGPGTDDGPRDRPVGPGRDEAVVPVGTGSGTMGTTGPALGIGPIAGPGSGTGRSDSVGSGTSGAGPDGRGLDPGTGGPRGPVGMVPDPRDGGRNGPAPGPVPDAGDELAAAACRVAEQLRVAGTVVNRRTLAAGLRQAGYRVRNDRLGHLLQVATATDSPDARSTALVGEGGDRHD